MITTLEDQIKKITGVSFRSIPADGKSRKFMVGNREWYAISLGDCGSFGCLHSGELYGWSGSRAYPIRAAEPPEVLGRAQMMREKEIVALGNKKQDSGEKMSDEEIDRYILALKRTIEAKTNGGRSGGRDGGMHGRVAGGKH